MTRDIAIKPGTATFQVTTEFTYTLPVLEGDPLDLNEQAGLELPEVYMILMERFPELKVRKLDLKCVKVAEDD